MQTYQIKLDDGMQIFHLNSTNKIKQLTMANNKYGRLSRLKNKSFKKKHEDLGTQTDVNRNNLTLNFEDYLEIKIEQQNRFYKARSKTIQSHQRVTFTDLQRKQRNQDSQMASKFKAHSFIPEIEFKGKVDYPFDRFPIYDEKGQQSFLEFSEKLLKTIQLDGTIKKQNTSQKLPLLNRQSIENIIRRQRLFK